jgi:aromatic ring-cleaving dioxygenase
MSAPYHAHIYYLPEERAVAEALRQRFRALTASGEVLYVGELRDGKVGPHPIPQFEIHFRQDQLPTLRPMLEACGLRVLIHPLTDDDLADHTSLGAWIGEPVDLDLTTLDPPGINQGVARFGRTDF